MKTERKKTSSFGREKRKSCEDDERVKGKRNLKGRRNDVDKRGK